MENAQQNVIRTQKDFEEAIKAGNYDFTGWHFGETVTISGDHTGKNFVFYRYKIDGDLYAIAATFNDLYASAATFNDLDASAAGIHNYNLSGATWKQYKSPIDFLSQFEKVENGIVVYKIFGASYAANPKWVIEANSVITELSNRLPTIDCGAGINVASLDWVRENHGANVEIWKCLIEWEWLVTVTIPFLTDGKFRCEILRLLEVVKE